MSGILIGIIAILIIICIVLVFVVISINKKSKVIEKNNKAKKDKKTSSFAVLNLDNLALPKRILEMDNHSLFNASKSVFDSFKALDYSKKSSSFLDKIEWHSWQVSLIIAMLPNNGTTFIAKDDSLFHKSILDDLANLTSSTQKIINKYKDTVNILQSRDELSKDISWSSREVSILFYYMAKNNKG